MCLEMKCTIRHIILILMLLLCLPSHSAKAQDAYYWLDNTNMLAEIRGHYGLFYHHHFEMERFNAKFMSLEASVYQKTYGDKPWQALYNYPYIGFTFYTSSLGNFEEIGKVYALYPFINYPLLFNDKSELTFKFGAGLAYLTNKFDHLLNPYNFSIGSHLNGAINFSFEYRQMMGRRFMGVASAGLTHFSNGATKSPNYGLNIFSGALGVAYYIDPPRLPYTPASRPQYYKFEFDGKKWYCIDLDYNIGVKDVSQTFGNNEQYLVHDLSARFLVQFTTCSRAGVSLSFTKDNSDKALKPDPPQYEKEYQLIKPNIGVCYSMTMDKLSYIFELGAHVNLRYKPGHNNFINEYILKPLGMATDMRKGSWYQKISLRYEVYDNIFASLSLTTHLARADFLTLGIGYRFNQKYYLRKHEKSTNRPPGLN